MSGKIHKALGRTLGLAAAAALATGPTMTAAQQQPVGISAAVQNSPRIRRGTAQPRPAVLKERILLNDRILTASNARMQILLLDRSTFTVGSNADVAIDRFVYDPARNSRSSGVSVARGAFRFMSGRALRRPAGPVSIRTPVASIGIRGTIFEGVVGADAVRIAAGQEAVGPDVKADPATATLLLLRGPGPRSQGDVVPGAVDVLVQDRTITLQGTNMALYVPGPGLPPIGPFKMSPQGLQAFQSLLRTTPTFAAAPAQAPGQGVGAGAGAGTGAGGGGGAGGAAGAGAGAGGGSGSGASSFLLFGLGPLAAAVLTLVLVSSQDGSGEKEPKSP
jgi:hypothetical protein